MSEPSETSGRPLALTTKQEQQQGINTINPPSPSSTKLPKSSPSSDDCSKVPEPTHPRRRPGTTLKTPSSPHAGSSRPKKRSTTSPNKMMSQAQSIHYTRTGRISKAKKGLKVHNCECGRSYTRAEHLRRHQKNHAQDDALMCEYSNCGKVFFRLDLLHRHQERHNDLSDSSPRADYTLGGSPEAPVPSTPSTGLPTTTTLTSIPLPPPTSYASPTYPPTTIPRYNSSLFRTPQIPRTSRLPSSSFISHSSPTSSPNPKQLGNYTARMVAQLAMPVDGNATSSGWGEQYGQSPAYSSSDDYASPIMGSVDYGNLYPSMPYSHSGSRTRTPSNASLHEHWPFTPRSPSSSISTMPYTWATNEKMPTAPLAFINTSYPMASFGISTSIEATADYGQFGPRTMMQRDVDEAGILFQDQPYGMGQLAHTYTSEQYLNNYWRLFHPTFPIIHRPTFVGSMTSSPMLHAAMIAIDGQYSNDTSTKQNAKRLHDRCLKLLEKRKSEPIAEPDRLCDHQAVFLVEVLSQFRARRAAKTLSPRFGTLYQQAAEECRHISSELTSIVLSLEHHENVTVENWIHWVELAVWQRLLTSCYVLESQQVMFLAREPQVSLHQQPGPDLPFPAHTLVWDAVTLDDWAIVVQRHSASPQYVYEVPQASVLVPCDSFQSSILVAVYYNESNITSPYADAPIIEDIERVLDNSFVTKQRLLTAKLMQVTPIRALLAVSGESWILFEKVPTQQTQTAFKNTLRIWLSQIWSTSADDLRPVAIAVEILQMVLDEKSEGSEFTMGSDMGMYFAALVLWAVTTSASTRKTASQQAMQHTPHRHHSQPPSSDQQVSMSVSTTSQQLTSSFTTPTTLPASLLENDIREPFLSQLLSPVRHDSLGATTLLSHDQIIFNTLSFLSAISDLAASTQQLQDLGALQAGCVSMLLWVKIQLRGMALDDQTNMSMWTGGSGDGLGELLNSIVGSLERIMNGGWTRWGI